jgi:hypothetical protein
MVLNPEEVEQAILYQIERYLAFVARHGSTSSTSGPMARLTTRPC